MPGARNLIVCRVGDASIHRQWIGDPATRSYDVWLDCFEDETRWAGDAARISVGRDTTKWPRMAALLAARADEVARYDAVWFPDDDVAIVAAEVERLFETFHGLGLALAQPALAEGSYFSFHTLLENRAFDVRFTNYVEVMAPLFSREALERCKKTFAETHSGWGIDFAWPRILGDPRDAVAVIDAIPMLHTRPVGSGAYFRDRGIEPEEEKAAVARRYGVPLPFRERIYAGIPRGSGTDRSAAIPSGLGMFLRLRRGMLRSGVENRGRYLRRLWRATRGNG